MLGTHVIMILKVEGNEEMKWSALIINIYIYKFCQILH